MGGVGGHGPSGAAVGGISCSDECIPLTGHRPFYNLISKKIDDTDFSFFFSFNLPYFVPLQEFRRFKVAANKLHVVFRMEDGAQTGFAFFAVTSEDLCSHSCRGPRV